MEKKCCPNCALYGVTAYLIGEQHVTPDPQGDTISDECPVPRAQELASQRWAAYATFPYEQFVKDTAKIFQQEDQSPQHDQSFTFDDLADIGDSFKEEK